MNYRHIYHAGNFADVFKHIMLLLALEHLLQKDKPFFALDTHAGIGLYDLQSVEAQKTREAAAGIARLWEQTAETPDAVRRYLELVRRFNKGGALRFYPGSPLLIREMLRADDRLVANELHPDDHKTLRKNIGRDRRVKVENRDGYESIRALTPPPERRGLVLTDPPFEVRNEFDLLVKGVKDGHKRWATGMYMLWYPVKDMRDVRTFHGQLAAAGIPKITAIDFLRHKPENPDLFNGSGLAIVNPPWTLTDQAGTILPWLVECLTGGSGYFEISHIAGES